MGQLYQCEETVFRYKLAAFPILNSQIRSMLVEIRQFETERNIQYYFYLTQLNFYSENDLFDCELRMINIDHI